MDINLEYIIKDYHRELVYSKICQQIKNKKTVDKYYVTTEPDPFFTRGRRRLPLISVTSVIWEGTQVKMEPTGINNRNRRKDPLFD